MESALIHRAGLLLQHERYADAETLLRENLAIDPDDATCMRLLGICQFGRDQHDQALQTFGRALALTPEDADLHVWRARVLLNQNKPAPAHRALDAALRLEPDLSDAMSARAMVFHRETKWEAAEATARGAMALDSDDVTAQNILSHALIMQGRQQESEAHIRSRLERDPENDMTHVAAGYAALRRGDHENAATHFSEALRLDPDNEAAREGLLNSYRARSVVYRSFLAYSFQILRLQEKYRWCLMIGPLIIYWVSVSWASHMAPVLISFIIYIYGGFVLWTYVAKGIGTLFILADSKARLALKPIEKSEAVIAGGAAIIGMSLAVTADVFQMKSRLHITGLCLATTSIPWSLALGGSNAAANKFYRKFAIASTIGVSMVALSYLPGIGLLMLVVSNSVSTFLAMFGVKRD